jgi:hypothetical protein
VRRRINNDIKKESRTVEWKINTRKKMKILRVKNEEKYFAKENSSHCRHKEEINNNVAKLKLLNSLK